MSMRLALVSDGLLELAHHKGLITKNQVNATVALSGAYHSRDLWAPTAARLVGRAAGYGSKSTTVLSPGAARIIASHPGTIGMASGGRKIPGLRAGVGRALGWASVVWFFATVESPGEVIEN